MLPLPARRVVRGREEPSRRFRVAHSRALLPVAGAGERAVVAAVRAGEEHEAVAAQRVVAERGPGLLVCLAADEEGVTLPVGDDEVQGLVSDDRAWRVGELADGDS